MFRQHSRVRAALLGLVLMSGSMFALADAPVWLFDIAGPIGPASSDYLIRGMEDADAADAQLVILRLDTPGGLDKSMRAMIRAILASDVPVATFVAPGGARAASAGTYLLYASHIAAMAPATNLGAATPVQMGGGSGGEDGDGPSAMEKKLVNDAAAYIRSLAELRGRNAEWAVEAVRGGTSLAAAEALERNVIDLIAADVPALLTELDGRSLETTTGKVTLALEGAPLVEKPADWRHQFLAVITDPTVAYVLMLVGIYGLIIEFSNPGLGLPGILGGVSLLIALYALQVLPISYAGLGLILLGLSLMVAEAFVPSFGVLGLGGTVAFIIGSVILMDTELPAWQIALPVILGFAAVSAAVLIVVVSVAVRTARRGAVSGMEHIPGQRAVIEVINDGCPLARVEGELWQVDAGQPLCVGDHVVITEARGIVLKARKEIVS